MNGLRDSDNSGRRQIDFPAVLPQQTEPAAGRIGDESADEFAGIDIFYQASPRYHMMKHVVLDYEVMVSYRPVAGKGKFVINFLSWLM
jgi:hypothetical protein